jgi:hypothetical protein
MKECSPGTSALLGSASVGAGIDRRFQLGEFGIRRRIFLPELRVIHQALLEVCELGHGFTRFMRSRCASGQCGEEPLTKFVLPIAYGSWGRAILSRKGRGRVPRARPRLGQAHCFGI